VSNKKNTTKVVLIICALISVPEQRYDKEVIEEMFEELDRIGRRWPEKEEIILNCKY